MQNETSQSRGNTTLQQSCAWQSNRDQGEQPTQTELLEHHSHRETPQSNTVVHGSQTMAVKQRSGGTAHSNRAARTSQSNTVMHGSQTMAVKQRSGGTAHSNRAARTPQSNTIVHGSQTMAVRDQGEQPTRTEQ